MTKSSALQGLVPGSPVGHLQDLHAFDLAGRLQLPVDGGFLVLFWPHPIGGVSLESLDIFAAVIGILQIDTGDNGDFAMTGVPEIFAEQLWLALEALSPVAAAKGDLFGDNGLGGEGDGAIPAAKDLEGQVVVEPVSGVGVVPEQVPGVVPAPVLGDVEEALAGDGPGDPHVVEGGVGADVGPVHGASHVSAQEGSLVDELENILHADGDVVEEDDGGVGRGVAVGVVEHGLQSQVAQLSQANYATSSVAVGARLGLGVDTAGLEKVFGAQGLDVGGEGLEDLGGAVVRVALDDGQGAVVGPQEADGLDDAAQESWQEVDALGEVQGEKELDGLSGGSGGFQGLVARQALGRGALKPLEGAVVGVQNSAHDMPEPLIAEDFSGCSWLFLPIALTFNHDIINFRSVIWRLWST